MCQRQLGLHRKPIALLNTRGFYDALLQQFAHMIAEGFLPAAHIESLIVDDDVTSLLDKVIPRRQTVQRRIKTHTHMLCASLYNCSNAGPPQLQAAMAS